MGFTALIGPAISAGGKLAGGGGKGGGGGGGGGISPQEAALAEYTAGQRMLANDTLFARSGTGLSTMKTFENAGSQIGGATQAAGIADTNLANQQAVQQSSLQALANSAGFGSQTNTGANTNPNVSTGADTSGSSLGSPADQLAAGEIPV